MADSEAWNGAETTRDAAREDPGWAGGRSPSPRGARTPPRRSSRSRSPPPPRREEERGRHYGGDSNPGNNLHVSGLSAKVTDRDLEEAFGKFGKIEKAQIMYDPHSREPRGFAFVTMDRNEDAEAAITGMNGVELLGRVLNVEKARRGRARTPTPGRYFGPPKRGETTRRYEPMPFDGRYGPPPPRGGYLPPRDPYDRYARPASPPRDPYDRYSRGPPRDFPPRDYPPPLPRGYGRDYSPPPRVSRYDDAPPRSSRYDDVPPRSSRYDDLPPRRY